MRIEVVRGAPDRLAQRAAVWVAERLWAAVAERGEAHLAVSGGATPAAMFADLARVPVPWTAVHVWQVDERVAPSGHPDRNAVDLQRALLDDVQPKMVHVMDVTAADLDAAAAVYGAELRDACGGVLDLVHLGLGGDGHRRAGLRATRWSTSTTPTSH
jgi:6-phosphogluconolactonase/glucosamine-6-phosphate isomerase/deaminase